MTGNVLLDTFVAAVAEMRARQLAAKGPLTMQEKIDLYTAEQEVDELLQLHQLMAVPRSGTPAIPGTT